MMQIPTNFLVNTNMSAIWKALKVHQGIIFCWENPKTVQGGHNPDKMLKSINKKFTKAI